MATKKVEAPVKQVRPALEPGGAEQMVYVGDNRAPNLVHGTVYIGGIPSFVDLEKEPMLKFLFVPIDKMIDALKDIEVEGTRVYVANQSLKGGK